MKKNWIVFLSALIAMASVALAVQQVRAQEKQAPVGYEDTPMLPGGKWHVHDGRRPQPPVVTPGPFFDEKPPSDAIVLFNGKDLSKWQSAKDGPAEWKVEDGYFVVEPGTGDIETREKFGAVQLHLEWSEPTPPQGNSQERGNSGVFLQGQYETQVLDDYHNITYPDGQAGAVYGQHPPYVNACRPPGEWQTYDIVFHRPRFAADGQLQSPARMTVFFNGLLVHDCDVLTGPTAHKARPPYAKHLDKLPISLQDHGHPVRYRNIWLRELE
jgi:hypothetical protein